MKPRNRLLYCRYLDPEDRLPGGRIHLLDGSLKAITSQQGIVEDVSEDGYDEDGDFVEHEAALEAGAWILHTAFKRIPSTVGDDKHFFIHEDDVIAVLE